MVKPILLLGVLLVAFIAESSCQRPNIILPTYRPPYQRPHIILPTYRPPQQQKPITRYVREAGNEEPQWLFKGDDITRAPASNDHPFLPSIIDDIQLDSYRRTARSLDSPSAKRGGGSHTTSSSSRDTGRTHPGYNRRNSRSVDSYGGHSTLSDSMDTGATNSDYNSRNTREIRLPRPFGPSPTIPKPYDPFNPNPIHKPYPVYARATRDIQFPGIKKPTHHDVIIPNWNPNARTNPWQRIGVKARNTRSIEVLDGEEDLYDNWVVEESN